MNQEQSPTPQEQHSKKPVVIYIILLFAAAFLLMSLSFLMSQRTNTEALGQLQTSVSAMQEIQATQETIIDLQGQLVEVQEELAQQTQEAEEAITSYQSSLQEQEHIQDALLDLYRLQLAYDAQDYEACNEIFLHMEVTGSEKYLPAMMEDDPTALPPAQQYAQLKEAVGAAQAQEGTANG